LPIGILSHICQLLMQNILVFVVLPPHKRMMQNYNIIHCMLMEHFSAMAECDVGDKTTDNSEAMV